MRERIIHIEPSAPTKPAFGQTCNGCGVCCLGEPCPLGMLLSRRRSGRCVALRWDAQAARYACGALPSPGLVANGPWWQRLKEQLVRRWIGAGVGCDCDWETGMASSGATDTQTQEKDHGSR